MRVAGSQSDGDECGAYCIETPRDSAGHVQKGSSGARARRWSGGARVLTPGVVQACKNMRHA